MVPWEEAKLDANTFGKSNLDRTFEVQAPSRKILSDALFHLKQNNIKQAAFENILDQHMRYLLPTADSLNTQATCAKSTLYFSCKSFTYPSSTQINEQKNPNICVTKRPRDQPQ